MTNKQSNHLNDLPYSDRQLVIVLPDEVVAMQRENDKKARSGEGSKDWKSVGIALVEAAVKAVAWPVGTITIDAINGWVEARQSGLNILQIGQTEAKNFTFQPGHPKQRTLYVAHPALPSCYYTTAAFHRMAFEHKFAEAIKLLMSLGANKIYVEHVRGWSRDFAGKISAAIPNATIEAGVDGATNNQSSMLFEATLDNKRAPSLPKSSVWYSHEPTWHSVAEGRLDYGLKEFSLTVNYEDDFGVNAGLKVKAENAGLELGGSFENHTATTWKIYGHFADNI